MQVQGSNIYPWNASMWQEQISLERTGLFAFFSFSVTSGQQARWEDITLFRCKVQFMNQNQILEIKGRKTLSHMTKWRSFEGQQQGLLSTLVGHPSLLSQLLRKGQKCLAMKLVCSLHTLMRNSVSHCLKYLTLNCHLDPSRVSQRNTFQTTKQIIWCW